MKIVLLGAAGAGKSALLLRLSSDKFIEEVMPTIGAAYAPIVLTQEPLRTVGLWDTAWQERYAALAPMYYRNADACLIVYDRTSQSSYERALSWIKTMKETHPSTHLTLVASKIDAVAEGQVGGGEGEAMQGTAATEAARLGIDFLQVSSKTGENFPQLRKHLVKTLDSLEERKVFALPSPTPGRLGMQTISSCC